MKSSLSNKLNYAKSWLFFKRQQNILLEINIDGECTINTLNYKN